MMHDGRHAGKEPVVRRRLEAEDLVGQVGAAQARPTGQQDAALPGLRQCLQSDLRHRGGISIGHASKANGNRRRSGIQEIKQLRRRRPDFRLVQEPVAGNVNFIAPFRRFGQHVRAETIEREEPLLRPLSKGSAQGNRGQTKRLHSPRIDDRAQELPEDLLGQRVGKPVGPSPKRR